MTEHRVPGELIPTPTPARVEVHRCNITCDGCGYRDVAQGATAEELDAALQARGWHRFGPSGTDLCFKCVAAGTSPTPLVQVKRPH